MLTIQMHKIMMNACSLVILWLVVGHIAARNVSIAEPDSVKTLTDSDNVSMNVTS